MIYEYHSELHYEIEDDFIEGKIPAANERIKLLQASKDETAQRLNSANEAQAKYYNKLHQPQSYKMGDLIMLIIKNLKQKRPNKKLSHKFVGSFRITDIVKAQIYRLLLFSTYRIHNIFHVSLLEPYHIRDCDDAADTFMQAPEFIDDDEMWKVEEIMDKVKNKQGVWYKVKWTGWGDEYNQWLPDEKLAGIKELTRQYELSGNKRKQSEIDNEQSITKNLDQSDATSRRKRKRRHKTWISSE